VGLVCNNGPGFHVWQLCLGGGTTNLTNVAIVLIGGTDDARGTKWGTMVATMLLL
jgi:hypothetical protein